MRLPSRERVRELRSGMFVKDMSWRMVEEFVQLVSAIVSFSLLGSTLGPEGYGGYVGLYGIIAPLAALTHSGAEFAALRAVVREGADAEHTMRLYMSYTTLSAVALIPVAWILGQFTIDGVDPVAMAVLMTAELLITAMILVSTKVVQVSAGFGPATRMRIVAPIGKVLMIIVLASFGAITVNNVLIGTGVMLTMVGGLQLMRNLPRRDLRFGLRRPGMDVAKGSMEFSLPTLMNNMMNGTDKVILNGIDDADAAGVLGAGQRASRLATMPIRAFNEAAFQRSLHHDENQPGQHLRRAIHFARPLGVISLAVAVGLWLLAPQVLLIVGDQFEESVTVIRWLAFVGPIRNMAAPAFNGLVGAGLAKLRAVILMSVSGLTVVLFFVLIPAYSWQGAIAAGLGSAVALLIASWTALIVVERRAVRAAAATDGDTPPDDPAGGNGTSPGDDDPAGGNGTAAGNGTASGGNGTASGGNGTAAGNGTASGGNRSARGRNVESDHIVPRELVEPSDEGAARDRILPGS